MICVGNKQISRPVKNNNVKNVQASFGLELSLLLSDYAGEFMLTSTSRLRAPFFTQCQYIYWSRFQEMIPSHCVL
jgi:hypothetical protein